MDKRWLAEHRCCEIGPWGKFGQDIRCEAAGAQNEGGPLPYKRVHGCMVTSFRTRSLSVCRKHLFYTDRSMTELHNQLLLRDGRHLREIDVRNLAGKLGETNTQPTRRPLAWLLGLEPLLKCIASRLRLIAWAAPPPGRSAHLSPCALVLASAIRSARLHHSNQQDKLPLRDDCGFRPPTGPSLVEAF